MLGDQHVLHPGRRSHAKQKPGGIPPHQLLPVGASRSVGPGPHVLPAPPLLARDAASVRTGYEQHRIIGHRGLYGGDFQGQGQEAAVYGWTTWVLPHALPEGRDRLPRQVLGKSVPGSE